MSPVKLIGENGQTVEESDCSNFGYSEDRCKLKCSRTEKCAWALYDTAAKGCGERKGYCGMSSSEDGCLMDWSGKSCKKKFSAADASGVGPSNCGHKVLLEEDAWP